MCQLAKSSYRECLCVRANPNHTGECVLAEPKRYQVTTTYDEAGTPQYHLNEVGDFDEVANAGQ
jgi:hypothetical protein